MNDPKHRTQERKKNRKICKRDGKKAREKRVVGVGPAERAPTETGVVIIRATIYWFCQNLRLGARWELADGRRRLAEWSRVSLGIRLRDARRSALCAYGRALFALPLPCWLLVVACAPLARFLNVKALGGRTPLVRLGPSPRV